MNAPRKSRRVPTAEMLGCLAEWRKSGSMNAALDVVRAGQHVELPPAMNGLHAAARISAVNFADAYSTAEEHARLAGEEPAPTEGMRLAEEDSPEPASDDDIEAPDYCGVQGDVRDASSPVCYRPPGHAGPHATLSIGLVPIVARSTRPTDPAPDGVALECDHCGGDAIGPKAEYSDGEGGRCAECGYPGIVSIDEEDGEWCPWWNTSQNPGARCRRDGCHECADPAPPSTDRSPQLSPDGTKVTP